MTMQSHFLINDQGRYIFTFLPESIGLGLHNLRRIDSSHKVNL